MTLDEVLVLVDSTPNVCVTGGEPLLQPDMPELLRRLLIMGKRVVLETNGSMDISGLPDDANLIVSMDIKCPMSGMTDRMLMSNLACLSRKDQLKFVIGDATDYEFALGVLDKYEPDTNVIFSPVGGMDLEFLADSVVASGRYIRVLPQLHKLIWGDRKSV